MKTLLAAAAVVLAASSAFSADLYTPEAAPVVPEVTVAQSSGWYLRGDAGYAFTRLKGAKYFQGSNSNEVDFDRAKLDNGFNLGVGVGYQINNHLRTDLTFDYLFKSDFRGSTSGGCGSCGFDGGPYDHAFSRDKSSMRAYSLLANVYYDIGTYGAFTPYVGAGIGGTYVKWDKLRNTSCNSDDSSLCDDETDHKGRGGWRFTYALMAGTSIDLTCNLKADVGYRYRHIEGGDMFGYNENGGPGYNKDINLHEARVGARYTFGGCQTASYMPPAEIPAAPVYK